MDDGVVVQLALVANRGEDVALEEAGPVEQHQRLVRVAGEDHLVERLLHSVLVLDHRLGLAPVDLSHGPIQVNLVLEVG